MTPDSSIDKAGHNEVQFRVTNSLGDTARLTLPVEVLAGRKPMHELPLKEYLVYLKKGAAFRPADYLKTGISDIIIESNVDMSREGIYTVWYTHKDGTEYGHTCLIAVVEE